MIKLARLLPVVLFCIGGALLAVQVSEIPGVAFFSIAGLWPLGVNFLFALIAKNRGAGIVALIASVAYISWFSYGYYDIFYANLDPQSSVGVIFIGIYSLKFMLILWALFLVLHFWKKEPEKSVL